MSNQKILLVDDEKDIIEFLQYNLEHEGFEVITAYSGYEALQKVEQKPDLVILDVMMPGMDGFTVCKKIRESPGFENLPVVFLTAKSAEADELRGLELGADDFIQKPVSPKKLVARVKSNLRRVESSEKKYDKIVIGPLIIDREQYNVSIEGEQYAFPKKEFEILAYLASRPGKVFAREQILSNVWGDEIFVVERTIDVHVRKVRERLGKYADLIETIKGVGYRFKRIE